MTTVTQRTQTYSSPTALFILITEHSVKVSCSTKSKTQYWLFVGNNAIKTREGSAAADDKQLDTKRMPKTELDRMLLTSASADQTEDKRSSL
jgi:hypothetical protein